MTKATTTDRVILGLLAAAGIAAFVYMVVRLIRGKESTGSYGSESTGPANRDAVTLAGTHIEHILGAGGTLPLNKTIATRNNLSSTASIPTHFDARDKWGDWIMTPRTQGFCNSCWSFASTGMTSDRFAIASGGRVRSRLSAQQMVSCITTDNSKIGKAACVTTPTRFLEELNAQGGCNDNHCNDGYLEVAYRYLREHGVTTEEKLPYTSGDKTPAAVKRYTQTGRLDKQLTCPSTIPQPVHRIKEAYLLSLVDSADKLQIANTVKNMQLEIMAKGPVQANINAPKTLAYDYKGGVYEMPEGDTYIGGHAITVIGWGEEDGKPYWQCLSSWGPKWGPDHGYFKVLRGQNEILIESWVWGVTPDLSDGSAGTATVGAIPTTAGADPKQLPVEPNCEIGPYSNCNRPLQCLMPDTFCCSYDGNNCHSAPFDPGMPQFQHCAAAGHYVLRQPGNYCPEQ